MSVAFMPGRPRNGLHHRQGRQKDRQIQHLIHSTPHLTGICNDLPNRTGPCLPVGTSMAAGTLVARLALVVLSEIMCIYLTQ